MSTRVRIVRIGTLTAALLGVASAAACSVQGDAAAPGVGNGSYPPGAEAPDAAPPEGDFVNPPGFNDPQTALASIAPSTFVRRGEQVVSTSTLYRIARRLADNQDQDRDSEDPRDHVRLEAVLLGDYAAGLRVRTSGRPSAFVDVVPAHGRHVASRVRDDGALVAF